MTRRFRLHPRPTLATAAAALLLPLSTLAADDAPPDALNVKVFPDRYVVASTSFTDLGSLEAFAKPVVLRTLWLDSCSPASTKQIVAAVERFQTAYEQGIQIRTFSPRSPECASADYVGRGKITADYFATDESGRSMTP
jgi:hypothetical protein